MINEASRVYRSARRRDGLAPCRACPASGGNAARGDGCPCPENGADLGGFRAALAELGYEEGRNFAFEFIQIPSFEGYEAGFRELVARKVDIIFHGGRSSD